MIKVRSYWGDIRLGTQDFPHSKVVETEPNRLVNAAIKGGLLQVVQRPSKPLSAPANGGSQSIPIPKVPLKEKSSPQV